MIEDPNTSHNTDGKQNNPFTRTLGYHRPRFWVRFSKIFLIVTGLITILDLASRQGSQGIGQWKSKLDQIKSVYGGILPDKLNPWKKDIKKRRFLVRDWSVWLGWNNGKYVIETALNLATLLDRELVLPAFHFANSCEEDNSVCDSLLPGFKTGVPFDFRPVKDLPQYPESYDGAIVNVSLPTQNKRGWVMPIERFLDTDHIVSVWGKNAIKFQDFLKLTNYENKDSLGSINGKWYGNFSEGMSYKRISGSFFTEGDLNRIDKLPKPIEPLIYNSTTFSTDVPKSVIEKCFTTLRKVDQVLGSYVKRTEFLLSLIVGKEIPEELMAIDHTIFERCIASRGLRAVYGFKKVADWMKAPYAQTKYMVPSDKLRGVYDALHQYDEQVLHIDGEIHNLIPPASMVFSTKEGRDLYTKVVRTAFRPPEIYQKVAAKLELKMRAKCGGRSWMASHMRRGDFIEFDWADKSIENSWNAITEGLADGLKILQNEPNLLKPIHETFQTSLELPKADDPIYLATNARSQEEINILRTKKAVLLKDLMDDDDKKELGKINSSFMDNLSILEQCLIMRSAFYYGDAHSSVTGMILNRRNFYGIDERLTKVTYIYKYV
ncbi:hypothetical protein BY996DRAFT_4581187 [Phakopsora pachyrhizi]|uniref:Uncharacterized protein n=1 Tax=Phakopsora pachyrhizi TaxID=170000 RepID=A0AAV0AG70_PHAPC|nr:hypothetical protein BY996DRAFT_4581187 [Phakopsora pachyrhizi]CAH7666671.1 hypothetical protein PPACK8108_LOCUS1020 [Phakopsora pachyrhizi]